MLATRPGQVLTLNATMLATRNCMLNCSSMLQLCRFLAIDASPARDVFWAAIFTSAGRRKLPMYDYALCAIASAAPARKEPQWRFRTRAGAVRRAQLPRRSDRMAPRPSGATLQRYAQARSVKALALLRNAPPDIASLVLEASVAHKDVSCLPLSAALTVLPDELHAAAVRGHFGAPAPEWTLDAHDAVAAGRLSHLLPLQRDVPRVVLRIHDSDHSVRDALARQPSLAATVPRLLVTGQR